MMRRVPVCVVLVAALAGAAPPARGAVALVGGTVHTVSGADIPGGTVLLDGGRIVAVGADVAVPTGAERIDVSGRHVYPGFIAANTVLGLVEVSSVAGTVDVGETGALNPNARAVVAINPDSEIIPVTRAGGVLTAVSALTGGSLSGRSVLWNLAGWTWEEMRVREPAALHVRWPATERARPRDDAKPDGREERVRAVVEAFEDARAYRAARGGMTAEGTRHDTDVRWEAMLPAFDGTLPVFVHADDYGQIEEALDFAAKQGIRIVIVGGRDAPRLAPRLARERVPVVVENVLGLPDRSWEPYDAAFTVAARLYEAGVPFCISTGGGAFSVANLRNLPYEAGMAAAFGLPKEEALRSITLYPARILGVEDRLGSIEPGKDANLIVTDGDPLEIRTRVLRAWIAGEEVDLSSRHTRLYERYRNRPRRDGSPTRLVPSPAEPSGR